MKREQRTAEADVAAAVRAARGRRKAAAAKESIAAGALTFRAFLESRDYFPDPLNLSPALWAIVDASDGRPDLVPTDICRTIFNCEPDALPKTPPRVVGVGAGRQGGKTSRLLAPKAVHMAISVPAPNLRPGQIGRVAIVAPDLDAATATLNYVKGIIAASEVLRTLVLADTPPEDPDDVGNAVAVILRRPDGRLVDIVVRAASRGGKTTRSRTMMGLVMDEACFLFADDGHTVNDRVIFDSAAPAILDGGQAWIASTPWVEGEGLLEQLAADNWKTGKQGTTAVVAARVGTRLLRPDWDPDGSIERALRSGPDGDANADREILATPLPRGSRCFFWPDDVTAALTTATPDGVPDAIAAGADYAHSMDRSAVAVAERYRSGMFSLSFVMGIPSSTDQKPSETYRATALAAKVRGARAVAADMHSKENAREEYERHGVAFRPAAPRDDIFEAGRAILRERRLSLARLPESDRALLVKQFAAILNIPAPGGRMKIHIPRATVKDAAQGKGTTHCDELVAALTALYEAGAGDPTLWANAEEREAQRAAAAERQWSPQPGSRAALSMYARGVTQYRPGRFW